MPIRPFPKPPTDAARESTVPAAALVVISFGLYWLLPGHFKPVPAFIMVVLVVLLVALLVIFVPNRHAEVARWQRALVMVVIAAITVSNAYDLIRLLEALLAQPDWHPRLLDYIYFSFSNGTAFSATDVMPLSHWAKSLMMVQAGSSLLLVVLVTARAVNVL